MTIGHCVDTVTGWKDPALTEQGKGEALKGAQELKKYGYVSMRCIPRMQEYKVHVRTPLF